MPNFIRGDNVHLTLKVYNASEALVDADANPTIAIADSAGTSVSSGTSTRDALGTYSWDAQSLATWLTGYYLATWTVVSGAKTNKQEYEFRLSDALIRLQQLKKFLDVADAEQDDDELLSDLIVSASRKAETICNRTLLKKTYTAQRLNGQGSGYLLLPNFPIVGTPTSVKIDNVAITVEAAFGDGGWVVSDADAGELYYPGGFPLGIRNLEATYVAGYDDVPDDLAQAVLFLAAYWYEERAGVVLESEQEGGRSVDYYDGDVPANVRKMLRPYVKPPGAQFVTA